ncbi:MAG: histidine phosphatase family protein [Patescibacteria group bacterium]
MKTRFYIVRHGETEANVKDLIQGQLESSLTKLGKMQAQDRAKDFTNLDFTAAYSSDLSRAKDTAKILVANSLEVIADKRLRERRYADLENMIVSEAKTQFARRFALRESLSRDERIKFRLTEGVENDKELMERLTEFLVEKTEEHLNKKILLVAHGDLLRSFLMWLGEYQYGELRGGSIDNLGYFVLENDGENFEVLETVGVKKKN